MTRNGSLVSLACPTGDGRRCSLSQPSRHPPESMFTPPLETKIEVKTLEPGESDRKYVSWRCQTGHPPTKHPLESDVTSPHAAASVKPPAVRAQLLTDWEGAKTHKPGLFGVVPAKPEGALKDRPPHVSKPTHEHGTDIREAGRRLCGLQESLMSGTRSVPGHSSHDTSSRNSSSGILEDPDSRKICVAKTYFASVEHKPALANFTELRDIFDAEIGSTGI